MSELVQQALSQSLALNDYLQPIREQGRQRLAAASWPTRKTEAWRYTPLRALEQPWQPAQQSPVSFAVPALGSLDVHLGNGCLELPGSGLPEGVRIERFSQLSAERQQQLLSHIGTVQPQHHLFGAFSDALLADGLWIDIADGQTIEQPIRLLLGASESQAQVPVRVLFTLGDNSQAHLIEHHQGEAQQWQNYVIELKVGKHARLQHQALYAQQQQTLLLAGWHCALDQGAELNSLTLALGSQLKRINLDILHRAEHATANLDQLYLLAGKDLFDLHSCIEHEQANGTTNQRVRGLVGDRGRAVFNGRIHIHPHAQKTAAALNTRSLLLSDQAEVDAKPELEIYADDVRCAHGATVSQLDRQSMFYLQSRGVTQAKAQAMLSLGFMQEVLADVAHQPTKEWLVDYLQAAFLTLQEQ